MSERSGYSMPGDLGHLQPDAWTAPFWEAARDHRLVAPRCTSCQKFRMPPTPFCWNCQRQDVSWIELSGKGTLYSFTIARQPFLPSLESVVPYVIGVVALNEAENLRLISNVTGIDPDDVKIGMSLIVDWDDVSESVTIPRFKPAAIS